MKPRRPSSRAFTVFSFLLLFILCSPVLSISAEELQEQALEPDQALSIISAYSWTNTLPRELIDLQNDVEATKDLTSFNNTFDELSEQIEALEWEAVTLKSLPNLTHHDLISVETKLVKINARLDKLNKPIQSHIQHLEEWYKAWLGKEKQLNVLVEQIESDPELHESISTVESLAETIKTAKQLIEEQLRHNLLAGQKVGQSQTRVYVLRDTVTDLMKEIKKVRCPANLPLHVDR